MRILHTADWHLGQTFFEYDRSYEHGRFLTWLHEQISETRADVLLIAGDVFDTPNPSAASQQIFYRFLHDATDRNPDLQIVIIAGNHDSAARLEAPNPLLEELHVTVRGVMHRTPEGELDIERLIIPLRCRGNVEGYCLAVPYLRQGDYPSADSYSQGVTALYQVVRAKAAEYGKPLIAMGHLQATGSEISECDRSERTVIGGLECVSPDAFATDIRYTALGHLHRNQRVSGRENVRYAGAPIPMSFAEKNNRHGVVCIDILDDDTIIDFKEFAPPVKLCSIQGDVDEVFARIAELPSGEITKESPYLEIKVRLTRPEPSLRAELETALQGHSVRLTRLVAETRVSQDNGEAYIVDKELQEISPLTIAENYFQSKYGESIPDDMAKLLHQIMQEVSL